MVWLERDAVGHLCDRRVSDDDESGVLGNLVSETKSTPLDVSKRSAQDSMTWRPLVSMQQNVS